MTDMNLMNVKERMTQYNHRTQCRIIL